MTDCNQVFQTAVNTLEECIKHLEDCDLNKKEVAARKLFVIMCSHIAEDMECLLDE